VYVYVMFFFCHCSLIDKNYMHLVHLFKTYNVIEIVVSVQHSCFSLIFSRHF